MGTNNTLLEIVYQRFGENIQGKKIPQEKQALMEFLTLSGFFLHRLIPKAPVLVWTLLKADSREDWMHRRLTVRIKGEKVRRWAETGTGEGKGARRTVQSGGKRLIGPGVHLSSLH